MKSDEGVENHLALRWTVWARNSLVSNGGFSPNYLAFGKKSFLTKLGEESSSPASGEKDTEKCIH